MGFRRYSLGAILLLAVILVGCGRENCILFFGDCSEPKNVTNSSGTLSLESKFPRVETGGSVELTVKGGLAPFRLSLVEGDGRIDAISERSAKFTATSKLGAVIIRVRDERDKTSEVSVLVVEKLDKPQ